MGCRSFTILVSLASYLWGSAEASRIRQVFSGKWDSVSTLSGSDKNKKTSDNWNVPTNWDNGVPSGDQSATIQSNRNVMVSEETPKYTGRLTLQQGSTLYLTHLGHPNAIQGASRIELGAGSEIRFGMGKSMSWPPIVLKGDAKILFVSNVVHRTKHWFREVDGGHQLELGLSHGCTTTLKSRINAKVSITVLGQTNIHASVAGSLGIGDVHMIFGPYGQTLRLFLDSSDTIRRSAMLNFTSISKKYGQGKIEIIIPSGVKQRVAGLTLDGVKLPGGYYYNVAVSEYLSISGGGQLEIEPLPLAMPGGCGAWGHGWCNHTGAMYYVQNGQHCCRDINCHGVCLLEESGCNHGEWEACVRDS